MADTTTTAGPATGEPSSTTETTVTEATKPTTDTVEFWRSKAREQEKRAKDNADAAKRLAEIEAAQKTEEEKAAERVRAAEEKAAALEFRANAAEAAATAGLPLDVVLGPKDRTPEGLKEFAGLVQALIGEAGKPRTPQPDPNQGRTPTGTTDPGQQFAAFLSRQLQ